MNEVRIPAYAKVNLRLEVLGKRADGYHELRTIFQTVSLHDTLTLRSSRNFAISLAVRGNPSLSAEPLEKNLVYRAVDALRRELKVRSGVEILLDKKIPAGRGLGGGSSNAAAALLGYLRLTGKRIDPFRLLTIAAGLGADVPFFLFGGCALGVGKGDEIYPLPDPARAKSTFLIVSPATIHVPTPDAYRWLHAPELASLTKSAAAHKLFEFCALCWSPQGATLSNDFEAAVFRRHARLAQIKRALLRRGASEALLAGSGSAVFGVFPSPAKARRAAVGFPDDQVFVCESISRSQFARALKSAIVS
jgi:4-diphosphocytidyl-2-C-methyl-D-erythritol kinase